MQNLFKCKMVIYLQDIPHSEMPNTASCWCDDCPRRTQQRS